MDWNRDSISATMSCGGSNMEAEPEWSWAEDKTFENALVMFSEHSPDRWENIARLLPEKSLDDILVHYEILVADVAAIEAGDVEIPDYPDFPEAGPSRSNRSLCERKKGESWTVEEHKCFLQGVEEFGMGDWRNICRYYLKGRSTAQVSSHAQKFSIRQAAKKKDGMRASIHDLTTVEECDAILKGKMKLKDATTAATDASATPSPSFDAYPFSQGRSNNAAIAISTTNVLNDADVYPFFSQGRSNDFSTAAATATAVTDVYARPSSSLINFDDSNFSQGRWNDAATATAVTDAYARPSPSMINFDDSAFSRGRSDDAAYTATATAVADAYARASVPSFIIFDDDASSQGRGQGSSPFNFK